MDSETPDLKKYDSESSLWVSPLIISQKTLLDSRLLIVFPVHPALQEALFRSDESLECSGYKRLRVLPVCCDNKKVEDN